METRIAIVLDASGSMQPLTEKTITGLNQYLADRQKDQFLDNKNPVTISVLSFKQVSSYRFGDFSNGYTAEWIYKNRPVDEIKPVTTDQYRPDGGTPLYDAITDAITELEKTSCSHNRNFVVIITDGEENASRRATRESVLELISKKQNENWTFVYLGANQDAFKAAGAIGIAHGNVANYHAQDVKAAYATMSNTTRSYQRSGLLRSVNVMESSVAADGTDLGKAVDANGNLVIDSEA